MNDYDDETGEFQPTEYVHVQRKIETLETFWFCSCSLFKIVKSNCDSVVNDAVTCCHCRLLKEMLHLYNSSEAQKAASLDHSYINLNNASAGNLLLKIQNAMEMISHISVSLPCKNDICKYAVCGGNKFEFVHVFQAGSTGEYYMSCQSRICQHLHGKKEKCARLEIGSATSCVHLDIYKRSVDEIIENSQHGLSEEVDDMNGNIIVEEDSEVESSGEQDVYNDCADLENELGMSEEKWKDVFDPETGKWCFKSEYGYTVSNDKENENLKRNATERKKFFGKEIEYCLYYPSVVLDLCGCGNPWPTNLDGSYHFNLECESKIFTLHGAIPCKIYKLVCLNNRCCVSWTGEKDEIFRFKTLCVGNEVGWYYIQLVISTRSNFSAFCHSMNYVYNLSSPQKFMDPKSFRDWWFSWASHQSNEFRQQCFSCGLTPSVLACDGTKIGPRATMVKLVPVEKKSNEDVTPTATKRLDRCFIKSKYGDSSDSREAREARAHLKYLCKYFSGKITTKDLIPTLLKQSMDENLFKRIPVECQPLFHRFINKSLLPPLDVAVNRLFLYLSYDSPLRSLIPLRLIPDLEKICLAAEESRFIDIPSMVKGMFLLSPIFSNFVLASFSEDFLAIDEDCLKVINYLLCQINQYEASLQKEISAVPITGSYNPPKTGRAYYFRPDGLHVRLTRTFTIDGKNATTDVISDENCRIKYPVVANKSTTFLFLWFCPIHGHCYGFHLINGSEGRKDPACSLYCHLENSPDVVYYDYACNLEEYALNRESGYFKDTRFYHDIFHSYNHKCSDIYKSQLVHG